MLFIGLLFAGAALYYPSLRHQISTWDDPDFVIENEAVNSFNLKKIFAEPTLGHYYPITVLTFAVEKKICGENPVCYHATNLAFHFVDACLLAVVFAIVFGLPFGLAGIGALIFLVHPAGVEVVAWISARNHLVFLFFFLIGLLLNKRLEERPTAGGRFALLAVYVLGLFSKELMLFLLPLILLWRWVRRLKIGAADWTMFTLMAVPGFVIGIYTVMLNSGVSPADPLRSLTFFERVTRAASGLVFYVSQYVAPHDMMPFYDVTGFEMTAVRYIIFTVVVAALVWFFVKKGVRNPTFYFAVFFGLTIFPSLKLIPFGEFSVVNDRYLYASGIGLIGVLISMLALLPRKAAATSVAVLAIVLTPWFASLARNNLALWRNGETLYRGILERYPRAVMPINNLGRIYYESGRYAEAEPLFLESIRLNPMFSEGYYNLGMLYYIKLKRPAESLPFFEKAVLYHPQHVEAYMNWGNALDEVGRLFDAIEVYNSAERSGARLRVEFYYNRAMLYCEAKRRDECIADLERTLTMVPGFPPSVDRLRRLREP